MAMTDQPLTAICTRPEILVPGCDQETMDKFYFGNMLELMNVA